MDIRKFFSKPGGGSAAPAANGSAQAPAAKPATQNEPPKSSQSPRKGKGSAPPPAKHEPPPAKKSKFFPPGTDGEADGKPKADEPAVAKGGAAGKASSVADGSQGSEPKVKRKAPLQNKKKRSVTILDSDADFVQDESGDDDDDDAMLVDSDSDDDEIDLVDSDDDNFGGKAAKGKAKGKSPGKAAGKAPVAAAAAGGKAGSAAAAKGKGRASGSNKKPRLEMVIEPHAPKHKPAAAAVPAQPKGVAVAAAAPKAKKSSAKSPAAGGLDAAAQAAIAAVDAAAAALPPESDVRFSVMPEGAEVQGNDGVEPPNYGAKDLPRGHPDCLTGKTFVISGVLDSLYRPGAEDLIKRHGGKVTGSVSGKTSFLVVGENCGRSKLRAAKEKGTKVIDEDGLFALITASQPFMTAQEAPKPTPAPAPAPAVATGGVGTSSSSPSAQRTGGRMLPASMGGPAPRAPQPSAAAPGSGGAKPSSAGAAAAAAGGSGASGSGSAAAAPGDGMLWVDRYKPRSTAELVGNPGNITTLTTWLTTWHQVHLQGMAPPTQSGPGKAKDLGKKAVLLSGPPGIGKTSAAHIVARQHGFDVVEMNASDTRNKSGKVSEGVAGKLSNVIREMATNTAMAGPDGKPRRQVLVMDEVDGMSGGDRGGVADLIQTIHRSKIPIICICNDKYSQKLKSLRNHCLELEFRKPTPQQAAKRIQEIAAKEGLRLNQATCEALASGSEGDMRAILGQMQMIRLRQAALSYDEVKGRLGTSKDTDMSPFECARRLLDAGAGQLSISDRMQLGFADEGMVSLLVQENYINHKPTIASDMGQRLRAIAKAADAFSAGDVVSTTLRRTQNWSLLPTVVLVGTVLPSAYMRGVRETFGLFPGEQNFPRFTAWMGNNSTSGKQRRLLGELATTMMASGHVSAPRGAVRLEYASALRYLLVEPLRQHEEAGIDMTVEVMQEYCINREQFDYIQDVTSFKSKAPWAADNYKEVPTKIKSAFTRTFNQQGVPVKCNMQVEEVKLGRGKGKGKGKGRQAAASDEDDLEEEDGSLPAEGDVSKAEDGAEDEEEELDEAALALKLKKDGVVLNLKEETGGNKRGGAGGAKRGSTGGGRGGAGAKAGAKAGGGSKGASKAKK